MTLPQTPPPADDTIDPPHLRAPRSIVRRIVRRIVGGVLFLLPIVLTAAVLYQVYALLNDWLISRVAKWIIPPGIENRYWKAAETYVTPPLTLLAVLLLLYLAGYLFQTRVNRWIDWLFNYLPGISMLYRAIRDVSTAFQGPHGLRNISTVVLVPFPHTGARMTGYLMGETEDAATGEKLACVYIPIGVFPPMGYTLIFPRADVTITTWEAAAVWKVLLSGGLTLPGQVPYSKPADANPAGQADPTPFETPQGVPPSR
jgi:uncharacterized membrane protein